MKSLIYAVVILLLVNSCTTTSEIPPRPGPHHQRLDRAELAADESPIFTSATNASEAGGVEDVELRIGESPFINEDAARRKLSAVSEDGEIVLNFEGESLQSVVHTILGEVLQETFVIGPGVSGQVTFSTSKPVSRDQLMPILELLLRWNGAVMVFTEGRYHILPVSEAVRGNLVPILSEDNLAMGYEVWVMPLKYIGVAEMAVILEPYVREGAMVRIDPLRNMIFLAGTQEELRNYQQTIDIFDVDWLAGMSVGIYPLETVDVESITTELTEIFSTEGESPLAGMFRFVPLERLASIMVITPQETYLEKARKWIETLDRGAAGSGVQLYVYRVKNLEAQILADYLTQLFGGTTSAPRQNNNRGTLAPGLQEAQRSSISDFNQNRESANDRGLQSNRTGGGVVSTEEGDIRITSVIETNSLLIQATQNQYSSIQAAIERIDQEPLQVLIESQILDVELNEDLEFGVNWYLTNNPDAIGGDETIGDGFDTLTMGGSTNFFANIVGPLGNGFIKATISALDSVTDVRSLGAPSLLVRNNATATITVGTQVPVQSSSISTGGIGNVVSSAQYVSTGVTLTVTPRINPGGLVYMDVTQEVSRAGARDPDISASGNPPINNKSVTSQVAVQSGQTIFLGGLISEQSSKGRTGVPYLNRIPIVGNLFGSTKTNTVRSETIVMITPTVIENINDLKTVSDDIRVEFMKVPPINHATLHAED
ncbi:MAG: type II secretion system secretin GspD [Xanthomonadales bacterium]|nr:type II secretion system secretin GspD [Xanthomonadales bacterium]